jgi:Asp-tRNA(Asn)/Glu-tRNA(Gln) amidotransferase A subunit family amidase
MLNRRNFVAAGVSAAALCASPAARADQKPVSSLLDDYDALGLAEQVRAHKVSPLELLEAAIERVEALNPRFNFMAQKHYELAREAISRGLPEGPFRGVPWLLKDLNTYIAGEVTENGSRFYRGDRASVTSELVLRTQRAGFVIFGKTTTPELGLTATTESKLSGETRNPWDPDHIAGGSSGGAAAAVAARVIPAAHATDGGGSIRIPASCCGLFGLKPSRGRIPMGPTRTEGWGGFSAHHALTHTVRDSAAIMDATHGPEPGSRYSAPSPVETFLSQVGQSPGRLRIALMPSPMTRTPVDAEALQAVLAAARLCEDLGHHVEEAAPVLDPARLGAASFVLSASSIAADLLDRAGATGRVPGPDELEAITLAFLAYGQQTTGMDYARANNTLQAGAVSVAQFMADYDVILSPTLATPPLELGRIDLSPDIDFRAWGERIATFSPFTQMANMTGQPSMSVPLAMSGSGLPMGVLFTGRYGQEALLFRLAGQLELAAPWIGRRPRL